MQYRTILAGAILVAGTQIAAAEQQPVGPPTGPTIADMFYGAIGAQVQRITMPRYNSNFTNAAGDNIIDTHVHVYAVGPAFTVGYMLDVPFGMRPRVEGSFSWLHGRGDDQSAIRIPSGQNRVTTSNGQNSSTFFFGADWTSNLQVKLNAVNVDLRFKTDFAMTPQFTLTPGVGLIGGHTSVQYRQDLTQTSIAVPTAPPAVHDVTEKLRTFRIGGVASLDGTWRLNDAFSLQAGVRGAVYFQSTRLGSSECIDNSGGTAGCDGLVFPTPNVNTSRTGMGGEIGGSLGGTYSWGWGQVSVLGTLQYVFNNPGTRNPTFTDRAPVSVRYDNTLAFGGMVLLSFPLN